MARNKSCNCAKPSIHILLLIFIIGINTLALSQNFPAWYLVSFTDKDNSPYNINLPLEFLSQASIDRRIANNVDVNITDLPVNPAYIDSLKNLGIYAFHKSKWLNAALVKLTDTADLIAVNKISIIDSAAFMAPFIQGKASETSAAAKVQQKSTTLINNEISNFRTTKNRIRMIVLDPLMNNTGEGINIAVFDNGFKNVNSIDAFSHLFSSNRIKAQRNFTNDGKQVYSSGGHGTMVLSTMAAYVEGEFAGSAIGANYFLFQTEDNRYEFPIEEANWLFAAEYADSLGVDIITSSLVYSTFDKNELNHNHSQLDGKTAIISRAAHLASLKAIIVFNSAGNEAGGAWNKICFPSDADGIITVGAVDEDAIYSNFSSVGYSADGRIKPDIAAEGENTPVISVNDKIVQASGTSFSTPFMAGAMATFIQTNAGVKYNDLKETLLLSASQYSKPDSLLGYGIPDFYFASILLKQNLELNYSDKTDFSILPNPFENDFYVLYSTPDSINIDILVYDISGKIIQEKYNLYCHKGNNLFRIDYISDIKSGVYVVEILAGDNKYSKKIVKK